MDYPNVEHFFIISDFNASNLAAVLSRSEAPPIAAACAPFGQVMQYLLVSKGTMVPEDASGVVVWTTPEAVSRAYKRRREFEPGKLDEIEADARQFAQALTRLPRHIRYIFVPTWSAPHPMLARRGPLDMNSEMGLSLALMKMNLALCEETRADSRIVLFDAARWTAMVGEKCYDPRLWYAAKTPYALPVFKQAASDFAATLRGLQGGARKLLLLDLDGTLWGGTVGEDGWPNLRLGGHDPVGEAYREFQAALRALTRRGILLGIASKNDERAALEAITSHPEMLLRLDDLAGWRINWQDKAENIVELTRELNLGLDSVVFIDDHPVERDRIRQALPAVLVPEWPANPAHYCIALAALDCFDVPVLSAEDRERTVMYAAERARKQAHRQALGLEEWLRSLELVMEVQRLSPANLPRAVQLLNKTNQFNLTTRRLSASEFLEWAEQPDHQVLVFNVADKFGDYGLVGIGSIKLDRAERRARVVDYLLSCRVFGRKVEEAMFRVLEAAACASGASCLVAEYRATAKNGPCLTMLESFQLKREKNSYAFISDLEIQRPIPESVTVKWNDPGWQNPLSSGLLEIRDTPGPEVNRE